MSIDLLNKSIDIDIVYCQLFSVFCVVSKCPYFEVFVNARRYFLKLFVVLRFGVKILCFTVCLSLLTLDFSI